MNTSIICKPVIWIMNLPFCCQTCMGVSFLLEISTKCIRFEPGSKCCKLKIYFTIKVYICTILFWMSCSNLANGSNNFLENFLTWELNTCRSWTSWTLFLLQILTNAIISSSTRYIKYTNSPSIKNNPVVCACFIKVTLIYINYKGTRHKT